MSTSKHTDKICIAVVAVMLVITILFMCGETLGLTISSKAVKYESTLFDNSYVHKIDIVMDDWDSFIENCENEEYSNCTAVIDGNKQANVAIRAKGNTSLSSVKQSGSQRYSFKLEFDHYEDGKTYDGLDKLCLNNLIQDNTMMKDYIAYILMNDFGADSPLCSFAYITVNGEDWGLYLAVEGIEDSFLSRSYGSESGELYKPDSMSFGGGRGNGRDFNMDDFDFEGNDESATEKSDSKNESSSESNNNQKSRQFSFDSSSMPEGFEMPGGMTPPDGFPGNGQFPGSNGQQGDFNPGSFPGFSGGETQDDNASSSDSDTDSSSRKSPGKMSFGGGMGSDDVKLKYIDDDPDSYSNIFGNAKTDVSKADKKRLIASLKKLSEYEDLENVLDTDEVLRYFVVHNFLCNGDSYTGMMIHNYYLHESDGKLSMIPWDYNLAFGTFQSGDASGTVNTSIDSPINMGNVDDRPMLGWIFSDETYTEKYHELFSDFIEKWFSDGELEKLISDTADMIRPYVEKDPTKFCTTEDFEKGVEAMTQFVNLRGEAVSRQLSGDDTAVETGSLNLSDMGSMGGGKGMGGFSGSFDISSMINLTDKDGNKVELSDVIEDVSSIKSIKLSDGTEIDISSDDFRELMKTDFSKAVSATLKDGTVTDISGYTISVTMPSGMNRSGRSNSFDEDNGEKSASDNNNGNIPGSAENRQSTEREKSSSESDRPEMPGGFSQSDRKENRNTEQSDKTATDSEIINKSFPGNAPAMPGTETTKNNTTTVIILCAVSFAVLALGILIALKKKY